MTTKIRTSLFLGIFINFIITNCSLADIYLCKDEQGSILYTDAPENNDNCDTPIKKEIKPLPSYNANPNMLPVEQSLDDPDSTEPTMEMTNSAEINYSEILITSPSHNQVINHCGGVLEVFFSPNLRAGDNATLAIDEQKEISSSTNSFKITNLERGKHTLIVKISRNNKIIQSSQPTSFMFLRNCAKR